MNLRVVVNKGQVLALFLIELHDDFKKTVEFNLSLSASDFGNRYLYIRAFHTGFFGLFASLGN